MELNTEATRPAVSSPKNETAALLHNAEKAKHAVTINRPIAEVYAFWRNFKNLPLFMKDLEEVEVLTPTLSRWTMEFNKNIAVCWDAEIIAESKNEMISWRSLPDSDVNQAGSVWFSEAVGKRGTVVRLSMMYTIPGGRFTELATKLAGEDPNSLIEINLRRMKALMETGEIPTTEGQPSGRDEDLMPPENNKNRYN